MEILHILFLRKFPKAFAKWSGFGVAMSPIMLACANAHEAHPQHTEVQHQDVSNGYSSSTDAIGRIFIENLDYFAIGAATVVIVVATLWARNLHRHRIWKSRQSFAFVMLVGLISIVALSCFIESDPRFYPQRNYGPAASPFHMTDFHRDFGLHKAKALNDFHGLNITKKYFTGCGRSTSPYNAKDS